MHDPDQMASDIRYLLAFVPPWAKDVPDGLDPTFYGTGTAEGDRAVKQRVDAIRASIMTPTQPYAGERDEVCHCGDLVEDHRGWSHNHSPIPMDE